MGPEAVLVPPVGIAVENALELGILGPLEVRKGGARVPLRGERQQALAAILLLHHNETLATDRLIDELWGEDAPETAGKMIQNNVWQLRKLLESEAALRARAPQLLVTRGRGYELRIDPDDLDANRFERLAEEGRQALAAGAQELAAAALREALGLWRGPALADFVHAPFAQAEIARLEQLRVSAIEDRVEADLAIGSAADLVAELELLVARYPLRERLRGQLMLALYRSGRQADALTVYKKTRRLLVEELGIEP